MTTRNIRKTSSDYSSTDDHETLDTIKNKSKKEQLSVIYECEPETDKDEKKGDLNNMVINAAYQINYFMVFVIWVLYLVLNTEVYIDSVLKNICPSCVNEDDNMSEKGIFISSILLAIFYIVIDFLYSSKQKNNE